MTSNQERWRKQLGHSHPLKELYNQLHFSLKQQRKFGSIVSPYNEPPLKHLYHYTTVAGLLGILESRQIRASLATHLNDSAEVILGQRIIWDRLASPWRKRIHDELDPHTAWANIYVSCFSNLADDLGQWRAYSGARGYRLKFNTQKISKRRLLIRVLYTKTDGSVDKKVEAVIDGLVSFYDQGVPVAKADLIKSVRRGPALSAAAHKPYGFSAESEWRIMFWCETCPELQFADRASRVVPFHPIRLTDLGSLVEVMVGPGLDPQLEKVALEALLRRRGFNRVKVTITEHGSYRTN